MGNQTEPKAPETPDYYADLGVTQDATPAEVKKAYFKLALLHHPDKKAPGEEVDAVEFRRVHEAYETLRDSFRRSDYDFDYRSLRTKWATYRTKHAAWVRRNEMSAEAKVRKEQEAVEKKKKAEEAKERKLKEAAERKVRAEAAKEERKLAAELRRQERERKQQQAEEKAKQEDNASKFMTEEERLSEKTRQAEERSRQAAERAQARLAEAAADRLRQQNGNEPSAHNSSWESTPLNSMPPSPSASEPFTSSDSEPSTPKRKRADSAFGPESPKDETPKKSQKTDEPPKTQESRPNYLSRATKAGMARDWAHAKHQEYLSHCGLQGHEECVADTYIELGWTKEKKTKGKCDFCGKVARHFMFRCPNGGAVACPPCKSRFSTYGA